MVNQYTSLIFEFTFALLLHNIGSLNKLMVVWQTTDLLCKRKLVKLVALTFNLAVLQLDFQRQLRQRA